MLFLLNPPRRGKGGRTVARKKKRTPPRGPGGRFRKRKHTKRTAKRSYKKRRAPVARKRSRGHKRTSRRRRGHKVGTGTIRFKRVRGSIYRRNPGGAVRTILGDAQRALVLTGGKVLGGFGGGFVRRILPANMQAGALGIVPDILTASLISVFGRRFLPRKFADDIAVGAWLQPISSGLKLIPVVGTLPGIGDYDPFLPMGAYDPFLPVGSYPQLPPGVEAYPAGEEVEEASAAGY